jgi:cupin 2 domain-containing protein
MKPKNLFQELPANLDAEAFEDILHSPTTRIERIVSKGHRSPEAGWYDQDEHEWVMVVAGRARLEFEDGSVCDLAAGDHIEIRAHVKHRVAWTDPDAITLWLAVFYR